MDSPTFQSNRSVFSTTRTLSPGILRLSRIAVEAPETAPPMMTTSYERLAAAPEDTESMTGGV